jgi:hypothetical protein
MTIPHCYTLCNTLCILHHGVPVLRKRVCSHWSSRPETQGLIIALDVQLMDCKTLPLPTKGKATMSDACTLTSFTSDPSIFPKAYLITLPCV